MGLFGGSTKLISNVQFNNLIEADSILNQQIVSTYSPGNTMELEGTIANFKGSLSRASMRNAGYITKATASSNFLDEAGGRSLLSSVGESVNTYQSGAKSWVPFELHQESYLQRIYGKRLGSTTFMHGSSVRQHVNNIFPLGIASSADGQSRDTVSLNIFHRAAGDAEAIATTGSNIDIRYYTSGYTSFGARYLLGEDGVRIYTSNRSTTLIGGPSAGGLGVYVSVGPSPSRFYWLPSSIVDTVTLPATTAEDYIIYFNDDRVRVLHSTESVYVPGSKVIDVTPVIPIKVNNAFVDFDESFLILNKLGIRPKDFMDGLSNGLVANAYVLLGVPIGDTTLLNSNVLNKLAFETFDYFLPVSGLVETQSSMTIATSNMSIKYVFDVDKSIVNGFGTPGTYTQAYERLSYVGIKGRRYTNDLLVLTKQVTPFVRSVIKILSINISYQCGPGTSSIGYSEPGMYGSTILSSTVLTKENARLLVPYDVLDSLTYTEYIEYYEQAMSFMINTQQTIKMKWYQSGFISFIVMAVGIVATGGAVNASWQALLASTAATATVNAAIFAITVLSAAVAIGSMIGINFGIFGQVAGVLVILASLANPGLLVNTLAQVNVATSLASMVVDYVAKLDAAQFQAYMEEYHSDMQGYEEEMEEFQTHDDIDLFMEIYDLNFEIGVDSNDFVGSNITAEMDVYELLYTSTSTNWDAYYG